jgi:hypothetical protein
LKDGQPLGISVDCYAGYRGEETPLRFRLMWVKRMLAAAAVGCGDARRSTPRVVIPLERLRTPQMRLTRVESRP